MKANTFCLAPFVHALVHTDSTMRPCCYNGMPSEHTYNNYVEWWNSGDMKTLRHDLYNGVKNAGCSQCWREEEQGKDSLRKNYNSLFHKYADYNDIKDSRHRDFKLNTLPVTWDLRLGNLCNLKCVMCSPEYSDKIAKEVNENKDHTFVKNYSIKSAVVADWTEHAEEFFNNIKDTATWVKLQGGEPFAIKNVREFLSSLNKNVVLAATTNATILDDKLLTAIKQFDRVELSVSLEAVNKDNDIIRYGSDFEQISNVVDTLKVLPNVNLQINHVVQATSIFYILDVIEYCELNNFHLSLQVLTTPNFLSFSSCPQQLLDELNQKIQNLNIKHPKNQYIKDLIKNLVGSNQFSLQLNKDLLHYTDYLDSIRTKKFKPLIKPLLGIE